MSEYRLLRKKQDLGNRMNLYRQQPLAIGILDIASKRELLGTLEWYVTNLNVNLHVMTTENRMEDTELADAYPEVSFEVFREASTTGEYINAFADECNSTFFLVTRSDAALVSFDGERLMKLMNERNHPAVITPVMVSSSGDILPTLRAPFLKGRNVEPLIFTPTMDEDREEENLYPVMEMGLYDRALFQRLRSYDTQILGEYYQAMDFGVRCFLFGYRIFTTRALAFHFPTKLQVIEDHSLCVGVNRFYTKALSIRHIAGKNVVEKWKPYVDKELLNGEVRTKQIILQKTDFHTLVKNWKIVNEEEE